MIDCILNFVIEHWMIIIPCFLSFLEFIILMIFKRRPKIIDNSLASMVLGHCHDAEEIYGPKKGKDKLEYVLNNCAIELGKNFDLLKPVILLIIGNILDCQSK